MHFKCNLTEADLGEGPGGRPPYFLTKAEALMAEANQYFALAIFLTLPTPRYLKVWIPPLLE